MRKTSSRGASALIRALKPFETYGALRATLYDFDATGADYRFAPYKDEFYALPRPTYVVWSYRTPIAWYTNGQWVKPDIKYSTTTSKHQAKVPANGNS